VTFTVTGTCSCGELPPAFGVTGLSFTRFFKMRRGAYRGDGGRLHNEYNLLLNTYEDKVKHHEAHDRHGNCIVYFCGRSQWSFAGTGHIKA